MTEMTDLIVVGEETESKGKRRIQLPDNWGRCALILVPYLWLLVLFLVPFFIVVKISLSDTAIAMPPYVPAFDLAGGWTGLKALIAELDFENFTWLMEDDLYWKSYLSSLEIASVSTLLTLLFGYPIAYAMARAPDEWRPTLLMLVILPFWTSFLIRVYAWIGILKKGGVAQSCPDASGHHRRSADDPEYRCCCLYRHCLFLPALHDPAALFRS